jgi:hypothetical protein
MTTKRSRDDVLNLVEKPFSFLLKDGFQVVDVELPNNVFWAVVFEGRCRVRVSWYSHDGIDVVLSKSGTPVSEYWKWYTADTLASFISGNDVAERFSDVLREDDRPYRIEAFAEFLAAHLSKIIDLITSDTFEQQDSKLKQLRRDLDELQSNKSS